MATNFVFSVIACIAFVNVNCKQDRAYLYLYTEIVIRFLSAQLAYSTAIT